MPTKKRGTCEAHECESNKSRDPRTKAARPFCVLHWLQLEPRLRSDLLRGVEGRLELCRAILETLDKHNDHEAAVQGA